MKKSLLLVFTLVIGASGFAQEIPNGGFKTFTAGVPNGWTAANSAFTGSKTGALRIRVNPTIVGTNDDSTAVFVTAQNLGTINPGVIVSGVGNGAAVTLSGITGGFPATARPVNLSGFAKYATSGSNHGGIAVVVSHWNTGTHKRDTLGGYSSGIYSINAVSKFTNFNIPITYNPSFSGITPDSIQIILMSSKTAPPAANEVAAIGDSLYVDVLRFSSCSPDPSVTLGSSTPVIKPNPPGITPGASEYVLANTDSRTVSYTFTASVPSPTTATFVVFPLTIDPLDSVHLGNPSGMPPGLSVTCGYPSCTLYGNSIGCYTISGTLPSTNDVKYTMVIPNTAFGISSFFLTAFGDEIVQNQGARPQDTLTITVGTPAAPITQTVTPGPAISPLPVRTTQSIAGGVKHSLFICSNGTVKSCGDNPFGQLGDGTTTPTTIPTQVNGLTGIVSVSAGRGHSMFLKNDSTVWVCGDNTFGQLGDGTITQKTTPFKINALSGIIAIDAGYHHSLFLKSDGTVWACGRNNMLLGGGQLGDGTTIERHSPIQVNGLTGIVAMSGGDNFSLFLKNDGTVWSCGANYAGQLGDGTTGDKHAPIQIMALSGMRAVAAGFDHSVFLKNDGTVWACGLNLCGELADGTTTNRSTPFMITSLSEIVAIDAGSDNNLYLKNDGTVWGSGINGEGELGDGTGIERHTPIQANVSGIKAISAGDYFSLLNKNDSTVWASGMNTNSQLGDGTFVNRSSPVKVTNLCSVFTVTGIKENSIKNIVTSVFPNPSHGVFTILAEGASNAQLTITNIIGEPIYSAKMNANKVIVDISKESQGYYIYFIKNDNGIMGAGKIIIE